MTSAAALPLFAAGSYPEIMRLLSLFQTIPIIQQLTIHIQQLSLRIRIRNWYQLTGMDMILPQLTFSIRVRHNHSLVV